MELVKVHKKKDEDKFLLELMSLGKKNAIKASKDSNYRKKVKKMANY